MTIRILSADVASQIAAGEVVERPASVVKELLENALDAAAGFIEITVEGAGRKRIVVADDGSGIPLNEISLAVSRHATSKLGSAEDLFSIGTLGFRGEALASIGSISRLTLTSRQANAELGGRVRVDGGRSEPVEPIGVPPGTVVRVEDLFYNVPARLKFLKSDTTERRHIQELVTRYALAYPDVRVHLVLDNRTVLQTAGNGDRREVLASLYGVDVARRMLEIQVAYDDLQIQGFISPIAITRSNRREIHFFVNGRWVRDPSLTAALIQAYHTMLMVGRYPLAMLLLNLPAQLVDVNVHPAKAEVRFRERDRVFGGVLRAVRRSLVAYTPVPPVEPGSTWGVPAGTESGPPAWESTWEIMRPGSPGAEGSNIEADPGVPPYQRELPTGSVPILRQVGQVGAAYLVAEGPDGLYLVDQHAAHERVLFEKFMTARSGAIPAQSLLEPVTIHFSPQEAARLEADLPALGKLGFQVEPFGPGIFQIRAIPALLSGMDPEAALRVLVEDFEEDEAPLQSQVEARIIARVCKRAAVKAGQVLSPEEQGALLKDLEACQSPRTCPHGRPTMIHLSVDLLERQFGRRGGG